MKHQQFPFAQGLPDAPLTMPKQVLEPQRPLLAMLRAVLQAWQRF